MGSGFKVGAESHLTERGWALPKDRPSASREARPDILGDVTGLTPDGAAYVTNAEGAHHPYNKDLAALSRESAPAWRDTRLDKRKRVKSLA